jgi:hypothetical protein
MTKDEALKLALEALEVANSCVDGYYIPKGKTHLPEIELAITAIKEALAQPEQEPIGYASEGVAERLTTVKQAHEQIRSFRLFTHDVPLYTTPPQRTWVGLTDGEVDKMILLMGFPPDWITENAIVKNIVRNLEAKLKEKNT